MLQFIPVIGSVISTAGDLFGKWMERKRIKAQGKVDLERVRMEGKIIREQTRLEGDVQYDLIAAKGMEFSWKDEFFALLIAAPFVACFIPWLQPYVKEGFIILTTNTPEWYQWAFLGAIVASFGLKDWFKNLLGRKRGI
jgi:hypothetical protein